MPPLQQTGLNRKERKEREEEIFWSRYAKDPLRSLCVLGGLSGSSARSTGRLVSLGLPYYPKCHPEGGAEGAESRDLWKFQAAAARPIDSSAHSLHSFGRNDKAGLFRSGSQPQGGWGKTPNSEFRIPNFPSLLSPVRFGEVDLGTRRDDSARVNAAVTPVVVVFDVIHVDGFSDSRHLVQLAGIAPQVWIIHETADIALEVADVDRVEAKESRKEPPVGLGDGFTYQVATA